MKKSKEQEKRDKKVANEMKDVNDKGVQFIDNQTAMDYNPKYNKKNESRNSTKPLTGTNSDLNVTKDASQKEKDKEVAVEMEDLAKKGVEFLDDFEKSKNK